MIKTNLELVKKLEEIFKGFEVSVTNVEKYKHLESSEPDMFLMRASSFVLYTIKGENRQGAAFYVLEEFGKQYTYLASANFEKHEGKKFGTRLIDTLLHTEDMPYFLRITDRSDGQWTSILSKFEGSQQRYIEL